jgi:hypothetical protein
MVLHKLYSLSEKESTQLENNKQTSVAGAERTRGREEVDDIEGERSSSILQ